MSDMSRKQFAYISALDNDLIWDTTGGVPNPLGFVFLRGACCVSGLLRRPKQPVGSQFWPLTCPVCHFPLCLSTWKAIHLRTAPSSCSSCSCALTNAIFSATFRGDRWGMGGTGCGVADRDACGMPPCSETDCSFGNGPELVRCELELPQSAASGVGERGGWAALHNELASNLIPTDNEPSKCPIKVELGFGTKCF